MERGLRDAADDHAVGMSECGSNFRPAATEFCQLHPLPNEPIVRCAGLPAHSGAFVLLHMLARLQKASDKILGNALALLLGHDQAHPGSESSFVHGRAFLDSVGRGTLKLK